MKRSYPFVIAAVLAAVASPTSAQTAPYGSTFPITSGVGSNAPLLFSPNVSGVSGTPGLGKVTSPTLGSYGGNVGLGYLPPPPLNPAEGGPTATPLSRNTRYPLVNCHPGGCSGVDGTQYARGAGNVMFGSNGKICQYTAPGAPLICN